MNRIINLAIIGSSTSGKTSLTEAISYIVGIISRLGSVQNGNTISDYLPEEIERQISISNSVISFQYKNKKINLIDTPGFPDFIGEVLCALNVVENCILVVSGDSQVDAQTCDFVEMLKEKNIPFVVVVNKLDKENINFIEKLKELEEKLEINLTPITVPKVTGNNFEIINFLSLQDKNFPEEINSLYDKFFENIISSNESLMEKYLNNENIPPNEIISYIKEGYSTLQVKPLFCISSIKLVGIKELLDFLTENFVLAEEFLTKNGFLSEQPVSALVFKTVSEPGMGQMNYVKVYSGKFVSGMDVKNITRNITERIGQLVNLQGKKRQEVPELPFGDIGGLIKLKETRTNDILSNDETIGNKIKRIEFPEPLTDMAVISKTKGEEEKVGNAFSNVLLEDPTLRFKYNPEIKQMIVSGIGFTQLEVVVKRIKSRYNVDVELIKPKIPYKETIKRKVEAEGKYKRQSGGRGQYGHCFLRVEPLPRGKGFEFVDEIFGGVIPKNYIPSVEKGVLEKMAEGVIAGYPVVDIKVTLFDGSYHEVDSSDMAFKIASRMALQKAVMEGSPCILEPIMDVEIKVPEEYLGSVIGDINSRRGRIISFEKEQKYQKIKAQIPLAELHGYTMDLRSLTKGAGKFSMKLSHYEELPPHLAQPLIEEYQKSKSQQEE
ncbi:MAG: elongation factor G [Elusimicrobiota bacterium]|nr:elongation factor G [Endomicrobiia bacterium]MDW8165184.1 elongation factor G [Elusimicrobiota bacterium]